MINLLPDDEIKKLGRERLGRFAVVTGFSLSAIVALGVLLLLPSYLSLLGEKQEVGRELELARRRLYASEVDYIEGEIANFNAKLEASETNEKEIHSATLILEKVLLLRPAAMRFERVSYESAALAAPERISLQGHTSSRQELLDFIKRLEDSGLFKKINSPISNLLREKNIDFSLLLERELP